MPKKRRRTHGKKLSTTRTKKPTKRTRAARPRAKVTKRSARMRHPRKAAPKKRARSLRKVAAKRGRRAGPTRKKASRNRARETGKLRARVRDLERELADLRALRGVTESEDEEGELAPLNPPRGATDVVKERGRVVSFVLPEFICEPFEDRKSWSRLPKKRLEKWVGEQTEDDYPDDGAAPKLLKNKLRMIIRGTGRSRYGQLFRRKSELAGVWSSVRLFTLFVSEESTLVIRAHRFRTAEPRDAAGWFAYLRANVSEIFRRRLLPGMENKTGKRWAVREWIGWTPDAL